MAEQVEVEGLLEAQIPFCGWYNSVFEESLEREAYNIFYPDDDDDEIDWKALHQSVSREYVSVFQRWLKHNFNLSVNLQFETMTSPREYNFETDRIFAKLSLEDAKKIFNTTKELMPKMVKQKYTDRPGYISFYDSNFDNWPKDLSKWDHNEIGTMLDCLFEGKFGAAKATMQILEWMEEDSTIETIIHATPLKNEEK